MRPSVYIETTIPSYYCDSRDSIAEDIARTREWWDYERSLYDCFISPIVIEELQAGKYPRQSECFELVRDLPLLSVDAEVLKIAQQYQSRSLMPKNPAADAVHLALASYHDMDYLLTWNCRHLANATKVRHLEELN